MKRNIYLMQLNALIFFGALLAVSLYLFGMQHWLPKVMMGLTIASPIVVLLLGFRLLRKDKRDG